MGTIARELARYIGQTKFSDLPTEVIDQTKMCILDWVGAALPGIKQKPVQMLLQVVKASGGNPECTIIGDGSKTSCLNAALVNGTISYAVKLDQSSPSWLYDSPPAPHDPRCLSCCRIEKTGRERISYRGSSGI